jgi:hypothetical protein
MWQQLQTDLMTAFDELGPELSREVRPTFDLSSPVLNLRRGAEAAERVAAATALQALLASLDTSAATVAAWRDLLAAYRDEQSAPELCDLRESQLAAIARLRGFDWTFLPGNLGRTIVGRGHGLELLPDGTARPTINDADTRPLAERNRACEAYLTQTFPERDLIVWVAIADVKVWRWVIELDGISFYDGSWWSPVVKAGAGQLPAELANRDQTELNSIFFGLLQLDPEAKPFVVARVVLPGCRVPNALERGTDAAMAVLHAAELRAGQLVGVAFKGGVVFEGNQIVGGNTFSLDRDFAEARHERFDDHALGRELSNLEPDIIAAARAGNESFLNAIAGIEWLKETRGLAPSQQVGLGIRAIEQVFAAIDHQPWRQTVLERLSLPWAITELADRLHETTYRAIMWLGSDFARGRSLTDDERGEFLEVSGYVMGGEDVFFLRRAVERLSWLHDRVTRPRLRRELRAMEVRFASGQATAAWLDEIELEFNRNLNRVHRLRNAILHGYPLLPDVVAANGRFARSIAIHAVHNLTDAIAASEPLDAHLERVRANYAAKGDALQSGMPSVDALGWTAGR